MEIDLGEYYVRFLKFVNDGDLNEFYLNVIFMR